MEIGFIGLGNMGFHMARRLVEAGHQLIVTDTRPEAVERLTQLGAHAGSSPADIADRVETVIASLPTPDVVQAVAAGPRGVVEGRRVRRFIDTSTTGSVMAKRIFAALAARNIVQIDSPVSGGVGGAAKGTLAVMASGPRQDVAAVEPVLAVFGKVFFIGEHPGDGQTMKLANNFLSATAMAATSEAIAFGTRQGIEMKTILDIVNASTGRNSATDDKFPRRIMHDRYDAGFTAKLQLKDIRLYLDNARAAGITDEVASVVVDVWEQMDADMPGSDITEMYPFTLKGRRRGPA
jgi:3-hydroxyisobutyrate dehydrogenase-like beta-hydroxyacid dehydrogenase